MIELFATGLSAPPPLQLSGRQVWLRPPQAGDWQEWATLRQNNRDFLTPWEPSWPPDSLTRPAWLRRLRRHYEEWKQDIGYSLLIFTTGTPVLVGGISLSNVRRGVTQTAMLGYWIGQPHTCHGYASDAVQALLNHAFGSLALHRVEAGCLPANVPSQKLLRKCGFREEGLARGYLRINGKWEDHLLFGQTADEWLGSGVAGLT